MFNDRFGRQKRQKRIKGKKIEKINTGNNSFYHEPLSNKWIEKRS